MKNMLKYLIVLTLGVMLFASCEEDEITLSEKIVGFSQSSGLISETSTTPIKIPVYNAAKSGSGCSVNFSFSVEGVANPAVEGTDFTVVNTSNTLSFANYYATDTIIIQPIDNSIYQGNKTIKIILNEPTGGFELSEQSTYTLTVADDEHPLALILGTFTETDYVYADGSIEAVYTDAITIAAHPTDVTKVLITNFWDGGGYVIEATVNLATNSMVIAPGQLIYVSATYGNCRMVRVAGGALDYANGINCTIDASGNITTESWAARVTAGNFGVYQKSELTKTVK